MINAPSAPSAPFFAVLGLWLAWLAYWVAAAAAAGGGKPVVRAESDRSRRWQSWPLIAGGGLVAVPPGWGALIDARVPGLDATPSVVLGLIAVAAGLLFTVWARRWLADNWSVSVVLRAGHALVHAGPYRWVRHPIYSGALLALLGSAVVAGHWRGFVGVGLVAASLACKIAIEERFLTDHFGDAYRRYRREVPALWPRFR